MNVIELISYLEEMDPQAEVRIASQPQWAFENSIDDAVEISAPEVIRHGVFEEMSEEDQETTMRRADDGLVILLEENEEEPETVVYLSEGRQIGYLPSHAKSQLGW